MPRIITSVFLFITICIQSQIKYETNFGVSFSNPGDGKQENAIVFDNQLYITAVSFGNLGQLLQRYDGSNYETLVYSNTDPFDNFTSTTPKFTVREINGVSELLFTGAQRFNSSTAQSNRLGAIQEGQTLFEVKNVAASLGFLEQINNEVYFTNGDDLWQLGNGPSNSVLLKTFAGGNIQKIFVFNNQLFMSANDGNDAGTELYVYDPSTGNVNLIEDINQVNAGDSINPNLTLGSEPSDFLAANNKLYFTADGGSGRELYVYNPTALIKVSKIDIVPNNIEDPQYLTYYQTGSNIYVILSAYAGSSIGREPVRINTSNDSATLLSVRSGSDSSNPENFTVFNDFVYFSANNGASGIELFRTNGLSSGTALVSDIHSSDDSNPNYFLEYRGELYFQARNATSGYELFKVDASNTVSIVEDFLTGATSFTPIPLVVYKDRLFMSGRSSTGASPNHLWSYKPATTFTGANSNDWADTNNWDNGLPDEKTSAIIPSGKVVTIGFSNTANAQCYDLDIEGNLGIYSSSSLIIYNNLETLDNKIAVLSNYRPNGANNSGSFIVKGTTSNNTIDYSREIHAAASAPNFNWSLISSPVIDANLNTVLTSGSVAVNGTNRAIATYNNNFTGTTGWEYIQTSVNANTFNLTNGIGYSFASASTQNYKSLTFRGIYQSNDISTPINNGTQNAWNLIGNPYTSFLAINNDANTTNNLLTVNDAVLDPNFKALYFWDSTLNSGSGGYTVVNQSSVARFVAPGQAFFVHSNSSGGNFSFTEEMQSVSSTEVFYKSNNQPIMNLVISDMNTTKSTQIKFLPNATLGLDEGFDAGYLDIEDSTIKIYTKLPNNTNNTNFMLQCVSQDYDNIILPIGIKATANQTITISLNALNLPTDVMVYLEDKSDNSFHRIDNANFTFTPTNNLDGVGRFYLHTSRTALSLESIEEISIKIFQKNKALITKGLSGENAMITIFDLLGKEILKKRLIDKKIDLPKSIKTGVYLVKIISNGKSFNEKLFIKN